jgi:hypothetical protein
MSMKSQWIDYCMELACRPPTFYANGNRKIFRPASLRFDRLDSSITLETGSYTQSKMTMLRKNYHHQESVAAAVQLWDKRRTQKGYGSVSFTCFAHFIKGGSIDAPRAKIASVFGPCLQSVVITKPEKPETHIDVFYRTTELFKKFPADMVFIRELLMENFNFEGFPIKSLTCHFANATLHPMYFAVMVPHLPDPVEELEEVERRDPTYHSWLVKSTARYLVPKYHRSIEKHSQSMSVYRGLMKYGDPDILAGLSDYLADKHPGLRWEEKRDEMETNDE